MASERARRAGDRVDDLCRACKMERRHTVLVVGDDGIPLRVLCDTCGSQHNYRGGAAARVPAAGGGFSAIEERSEAMAEDPQEAIPSQLELLLRRVIREETGLTPVAPAERWRGGQLVLRPGREGVQEKAWPIAAFFHKIVMIRNRLRTLEQQLNSSDLPDDLKLKLQGYVTACYGTLTSFNVLFADEADRFRGSGD
jgi:hypothetical protein